MKVAIDVLAERLTQTRATEKTRAVVEQRPLANAESTASGGERRASKGHGRHGASAFTGAQKVAIRHANLTSGDRCPECARGRVYTQQKPKTLVRIVGRAPVEATVYEMERLRCLCFMRHRQRYAASGTMPHLAFAVNSERLLAQPLAA